MVVGVGVGVVVVVACVVVAVAAAAAAAAAAVVAVAVLLGGGGGGGVGGVHLRPRQKLWCVLTRTAFPIKPPGLCSNTWKQDPEHQVKLSGLNQVMIRDPNMKALREK